MELIEGIVVCARYRLEHLLGQGGMGVVWAAEELATGERHALKFLKASSADASDATRRLIREARAAATVRHPAVVRIVDVLELDDGQPVIAMELLAGESLRDRLARDGRLGLAELADIAMPTISAVGTAHALGIVHRDLKPEHLFLTRGLDGERTVKVLDFGIAKLSALDGETRQSTGLTTGAVLGTPAYMAPEQVFGESDLDHRADIWALGVVLYECLSGVLPTRGDNVGQVLKNVLAKPFEPLDRLVPELPGEIARLVARMLSRDRDGRPGDLREVAELLAPWARAPAVPFAAPAERFGARRGAARQNATAAQAGLADTIAAPPRPAQTSRRLAWLALAPLAATAIAIGAWWRTPEASPLASPDARLACPVLRASGVEAPAGWLGAATAAVACERARVILGGRPERTLAPAELLGLPRTPRDDFPVDPYAAPATHEASLAAARQTAQAYLDGDVAWSAAGFTVVLSLRRPDGSALSRATGRGRGLYEAVREAMAPLTAADRIPKASALAPEIAGWARTASVDDALGVLDLRFGVTHNAGNLPAECQQFAAMSARVPELGPEGRWLCAMTLGRPDPGLVLNTADASETAVATRMRIHHMHRPGEPQPKLDLPALFAREAPWGKSFVAAIQSCLLGAPDPRAALAWAHLAVQNAPSSAEGATCNPWEQLVSLERDTSGAAGAIRAMQAWQPWNSYAWLGPGFRAGADPAALRLARRARVLSPFDAYLAGTVATSLLAAGLREEASTVAAELRGGGLWLHRVESELILVRIEISQARFGQALEHAQRQGEPSSADLGWVRTQRFEIAWCALELAVLLGRGRELADWMVERFVDQDPPRLEPNFPAAPMRFAAICALASAPERCFARMHAGLPRLPGAVTAETAAFARGAECYAQRDYAGAAQAWRPLLGDTTAPSAPLPDAMVEAFERTGADNLAEQVDRAVMVRAGEFHGATLGHARSAARASARGDRDTARRLAEQVQRAWSVADEPPPALAEMRRLLAELDAR